MAFLNQPILQKSYFLGYSVSPRFALNVVVSAILAAIIVIFVVKYHWRSWKNLGIPVFGQHYSLKGKHVCITGGSEGIGLDVALESLQRGATTVTILARDGKKLRNAVDYLAQNMNKATENEVIIQALSCDVANPDAVAAVFRLLHHNPLRPDTDGYCKATEFVKGAKIHQVSSEFYGPVCRPVDILVAAAGMCICDTFEHLSPKELELQFRVNVLGSLYPCQELFKTAGQDAAKGTPRQRVIVLLASVAAQVNIYGFVGYGASKYAIRGAWEAMTMEGEPLNIRVMCVFPPSTDTPGYAQECRRKPRVTSVIEGTVAVWSSKAVATRIIRGIENGLSRRITFGASGYLIAALTQGMAPASHIYELMMDLFLLYPAKLIAVILSVYWKTVVCSDIMYRGKPNNT